MPTADGANVEADGGRGVFVHSLQPKCVSPQEKSNRYTNVGRGGSCFDPLRGPCGWFKNLHFFSWLEPIPPPGAAEVDEIGPPCRSSRPPFARGGASPVLLGCGCSPPCHVDFAGCPHGSSSTSAALGACGALRGMLRLSLNVVSRRAIGSNLGRSPPARIRRLRSERRPISAPPP